MKRKLILALILTLAVLFTATAADAWYYNMEISEFSYSGVINIKESDINDALYVYRYKPFTNELFAELQEKLYAIDGVDFFTADAEKTEATKCQFPSFLLLGFQAYLLLILSCFPAGAMEERLSSCLCSKIFSVLHPPPPLRAPLLG